MADKQVAVRLVVQGGDKAKADFRGVGAAGDQAMQQLGRSAKTGGTALRTSTSDMALMARESRTLGLHIQNASYQVGDFFVQVAGGQDAMRAAAQQLPQLLGGMGMWGAVAGAAVAVGAALIPMFMGGAESADTFEKSLSDLNDMMRQHREVTEAATMPMVDLLDKFGENAVAARDLFETLALIERIKLTNKLDALKTGLGGAPSDIGALVQEYIDAAAMTDGGGQQVAMQAQEALRESYGLTIAQAKEVKAAMDQLAEAEGPEQVAQAAQALAVALLEARNEGARIPPEMLAAADQAAGEATAASSGAGSATELALQRFTHFNGSVSRNGEPLGNLVSGSIKYSNGLDRIETVRADGKIDGVDPGRAALSGQCTLRFADRTLYNQAVAGTPCEMAFSYAIPDGPSLVFTAHAVYFSRPRREISGPQGVSVTFDWIAAKAASPARMCTAVLSNGQATY